MKHLYGLMIAITAFVFGIFAERADLIPLTNPEITLVYLAGISIAGACIVSGIAISVILDKRSDRKNGEVS